MDQQKKGTISIELQATSQQSPEDIPSPVSSTSSSIGTDRDVPETTESPTTSTSEHVRESTRTLSATFSEQFNMQEDAHKWKGMVKSHYIDKKLREKCHGCFKSFKIKRRPRHCRRCGELFCNDCLQYKRRLNKLAHPDPGGQSRKVCHTCYNEDSQILGHIRSWTNDFHKERDMCKHERILNQRANSKTQTFWRDQLDIPTECKRLLDGFEYNVGQSESKKNMQELRSVMRVPQWQKSKFWQVENVSNQCRQCKKSLGVRKTRRNCKVCSLALCRNCSHKELLIYYDDETESSTKCAKLALINVKGCPEKEPNISFLLYICAECKSYVHEKQQENPAWYESLRDDSPLAEINTMNTMFANLTNKISTTLQKFEDHGLTDNHTKGNNDLALLDIQLNTYHTLFKSLQKVLERSETKTQHTFIKNFTQGKYTFYMEARRDYRKLCKDDRDRK